MKICFCIAEYNPLHLGHLKHIEYMKKVLGAEKIVVLMSGNFTQRGEIAVMNKFKRARQAIIAGADLVLELPTVFATANAETFSKGAINIISSLGVGGTLCFGVESGTAEDYISLADALNDESKEFKKAIKDGLDSGLSLAKAKFEAVKKMGGKYDEKLISSPNNILGIEYTKAVLKCGANLEICPMIREGDHNDETLKKGITSATSIRNVIKSAKYKKIKKSVPSYVYEEISSYPYSFDKLIMSHALTVPTEKMKQVPDCTEGLENRIKALAKDSKNAEELINKCTTKRYTSSRIRRILTANLLGIEQSLLDDCLNEKLYAKVLAVSVLSKGIISEIADNSSIPLLTRKSDTVNLKKTAKKCFDIDTLANDIYDLISEEKTNENQMLIV